MYIVSVSTVKPHNVQRGFHKKFQKKSLATGLVVFKRIPSVMCCIKGYRRDLINNGVWKIAYE